MDVKGIIIQSTTNSLSEAKLCAHHLIESNLAACVTIIPTCTSVYKYNGNIHEDEEYEIHIKSFSNYKNSIFQKVEEKKLVLNILSEKLRRSVKFVIDSFFFKHIICFSFVHPSNRNRNEAKNKENM